ncbi:MAG: lipopolysaccharide heptosyltransferase II [Candidatus Cloacimonetes bacterium]|nr:lipopolysaccharide heptosyltransferase II [Candidatus Cloacimonadota bacterium]
MKILLIRLSSIGDVVLTQPIAESLRNKYPQAQIDFITKPAFATIVSKFGCIDNIHSWDESWQILKKLRKENYDLCLDLHAKLNTTIIRIFSNAKKTVVYSKQHLLRKKIVQHKTAKTISSTVELYYSALDKLSLNLPHLKPKLYLDPQKFVLEKSSDKLIGIFPGALHQTKQYPPAKFVELIEMLPKDYKIFIFGSKSENDLAKQLMADSARKLENYCGKLTLDQLCYYVQAMDLIISNDSGPMHIAAALQKKQIAIFGATHPKLGFAPQNDNAIVISADTNCQPCSLHGGKSCPLIHFNCMNSLDNRIILNHIKIK